MSVFSVFRSAPNFVKYRFEYLKTLLLIYRSKKWTQAKIEKYQISKINKLLIDFYGRTKLYDDMSISRISKLDDLKKVPLTLKSDHRNFASCVRTEGRNLYKTNTGGTSGEALFMMKSKKDLAKEKAYVDSLLIEAGINVFSIYSQVRLRGDSSFDGTVNKNSYKNYSMSSFKINDQTIIEYVNNLELIKPDVIFSYPSSLFFLCKHIAEEKIVLDINPKCIVLSSEIVFPFQVQLIKEVFNCQIINLFGNTEHTIFAVDRFDGKGFYTFPTYSYVEFVDGSIITTGFNDDNMFFLRYKTEDLGNKIANNYNELIGREQDIIVDSLGQKLPVVGLIFGQHFSIFDIALEIKIVQRVKGKITIFIYTKEFHLEEHKVQMIEGISASSSGGISAEIVICDSPLPKTNRGKLKFFESEL